MIATEERRQMGRSAAMSSHDPLEILRSRYWPVRPDGSFDVLAYGRAIDAAANRGAGAPRPDVRARMTGAPA